MEGLYKNAIEELESLRNNEKFKFYLTNIDSATEETVQFGEINRQRNLFNKLPLKNIKNFIVPRSSMESLSEFIDILKILRDLDIEFKVLIEEYRSSFKTEYTYELISGSLLNTINEAQYGQNFNNSKVLLREAIIDLFSNKYQRNNLSNMYFYFYYKTYAYISEYYKNILDLLADFFIRELCIDIPDDISAKRFINEQRNHVKEKKAITNFLNIGNKFTFLSYAFHDKLISFLIFLEARSKKTVLFVDWMYSVDYTTDKEYGTINLKNNLNYFLSESNKLLFLRSINSELNTAVTIRGLFAENKKMVRQWCSWEIGNFYRTSLKLDSEPKKYQYFLHKDLSEGLENLDEDVEDNILLKNFEPINNISELYNY